MTSSTRWAAEAALRSLVARLDPEGTGADTGVEALGRRYAAVKGRLGRAGVAARLGLSEEELASLDAALRAMIRQGTGEAGVSPRVEAIVMLRFLSWCETIGQRTEDPSLSGHWSSNASGEELARKQVRALELILRGLISERYGDQTRLRARLWELLSERVVSQWLSASDPGDILSGSSFSDLASLFVAVEEFPGYEPLFANALALGALGETRHTVRLFLDDIRRIRNQLAHHRQISPLRVELLATYYAELIDPVQHAFDRGETRVDPDRFLDASAADMELFLAGLREDAGRIRDDIADLRQALEASLLGIAADTAVVRTAVGDIQADVQRTHRGQRWLLAGIAAALLLGAWILRTAWSGNATDSRIEEAARRIEQRTQATQAAVEETRDFVTDMAESLRQLTAAGGIVANPTTPAELYYNARQLAERGQPDSALTLYSRVLGFELPYADPVIDMVNLVKATVGESRAAAEVNRRLPETAPTRIRQYASLLAGGEDLAVTIQRLSRQEDPYLPAIFEANQRMIIELDSTSLGMWQDLIPLIGRLASSVEEGSLRQYYLNFSTMSPYDITRMMTVNPEDDIVLQSRVSAFRQPLKGEAFLDSEAMDLSLIWAGIGGINNLNPRRLVIRMPGIPGYERGKDVYDSLVDPETGSLSRELTIPLPTPLPSRVLLEAQWTERGGYQRQVCLAFPVEDGFVEAAAVAVQECAP